VDSSNKVSRQLPRSEKFRYVLVDVFTNRAFGGNPLAVFPDGQGLDEVQMRALANELHLSETTFVLPARQAGHDYQVRIFTPSVELPMAGHPTIGTSFVLAHEGMISLGEGTTRITLEEGVGPVPVSIQFDGSRISQIEMQQPLPEFGPRFEQREVMADMLSLSIHDLDEALPIQIVSCGVPFLYIPVRSIAAMKRIRFKTEVFERELSNNSASVFVFARGGEEPGSTVHSRMFAPNMGIPEDPATGAASGPLGSYLVRYGLVEAENGVADLVSEQGIEMGRPSFVRIRVEQRGDEITGVYVGGECHFMGEGVFQL
jgi:trans-2,3-dihydro-3-hydroxyanthranilate isomerase